MARAGGAYCIHDQASDRTRGGRGTGDVPLRAGGRSSTAPPLPSMADGRSAERARFGDQQNEKEGELMTEAAEGTLLWEPSEEFKENANITHYMRWLKEEKNLSFEDYGEI